MVKITMPGINRHSQKYAPWAIVLMGLLMIGLIFLPRKNSQCGDNIHRPFNKNDQSLIIYGLITIGFGYLIIRFNKNIRNMFIEIDSENIQYFWLENSMKLISIPKFEKRKFRVGDVKYYKVMKWFKRLELGFNAEKRIFVSPSCKNAELLLRELKSMMPDKEIH